MYAARFDGREAHDSNANIVFEDTLASLNRYHSKFSRCSSVILRLSGRGAEYTMVEDKLGQLCRVVKHVEEMYCAAMEDPGILISAHTSGSLTYQAR